MKGLFTSLSRISSVSLAATARAITTVTSTRAVSATFSSPQNFSRTFRSFGTLRLHSTTGSSSSSVTTTDPSDDTTIMTATNNSNDNDDTTTTTTPAAAPVVPRPDEYVPPKVWTWDDANGGRFAKTNRPIAGPTHEQTLPVGKHALQLYSLATPNGIKVTIMLEELLDMGIVDAEYDAWHIMIDGPQFGTGFVEVNPNSKIPALMDHAPLASNADASGSEDREPLRVFESGSILLYLGDKFGALIPPVSDIRKRTECINWVMWQMGSAPFVGGGFGHFFAYAPFKMEYPINRYTMETKRQFDVLDRHLADHTYMVGDDYTIADIAIWSWYGQLALNTLYDGSFEFLDMASYKNVQRWAKMIAERPAVKRGKMVNKSWGPLEEQLHDRHSASDFETSTQDKIVAARDQEPKDSN